MRDDGRLLGGVRAIAMRRRATRRPNRRRRRELERDGSARGLVSYRSLIRFPYISLLPLLTLGTVRPNNPSPSQSRSALLLLSALFPSHSPPSLRIRSSSISLDPPSRPHLLRNMSTASRRRLIRDFKRLQSDPPGGISGAPNADNIMVWNAVIFGPGESRSKICYEKLGARRAVQH